MRSFVLAAVLLCLAACTPRPDDAASSAQPCAGAASRTWDHAGESLIISAMAVGDTCATASAELKVVDRQNQTLFQQNYPIEHVMVLAGATSADLQAKLTEWIGDAPQTTSALPDWPEGAAQPMSGEFPFYPSEGVTREMYLEARAANAPMWCFVQGMESQACLVLRDGRLTDLGAQSFPG